MQAANTKCLEINVQYELLLLILLAWLLVLPILVFDKLADGLGIVELLELNGSDSAIGRIEAAKPFAPFFIKVSILHSGL